MLCRKKAESYSYFQIMGVWLRICVQVMLIIYEKILSMKKKMLTYLNIQYIILTFVVNMRKWRNWQTRRLQVPVVARSCGFKSHFLHSFLFYPKSKKTEAHSTGASVFLFISFFSKKSYCIPKWQFPQI